MQSIHNKFVLNFCLWMVGRFGGLIIRSFWMRSFWMKGLKILGGIIPFQRTSHTFRLFATYAKPNTKINWTNSSSTLSYYSKNICGDEFLDISIQVYQFRTFWRPINKNCYTMLFYTSRHTETPFHTTFFIIKTFTSCFIF